MIHGQSKSVPDSRGAAGGKTIVWNEELRDLNGGHLTA
jgi:hypothetical protein